MNRNFDANWKAGTYEYKVDGVTVFTYTYGEEPISEAETQALRNYLIGTPGTQETGHPEILFVVNRHDAAEISQNSNTHAVPYCSDTMMTDRRVFWSMMQWVSPAIRAKYTKLTEWDATAAWRPMFRCWEDSINMGTMDKWLNMIGFHGSLLECPIIGGYAQQSLQMGFEISINLLLTILANADFIRSSDDVHQVYYQRADYGEDA